MALSPRKSSYKHRWLAKASWRGTSMKFYIDAQNEAQALKKAEGQVFRMQGGMSCLEVKIVEQLY